MGDSGGNHLGNQFLTARQQLGKSRQFGNGNKTERRSRYTENLKNLVYLILVEWDSMIVCAK